MENASPRRRCPAPEGGCRYVIWNPIGKWCNLAGEDCVMVDRKVGERKILIDTRADSIDGGWSDFGDWSECSAECGGGTQERTRECNNPAPEGGADCAGDASESRACNTQECPIELEWRRQPKEQWFAHDWENEPLYVKTVSSIGSNDEIFFEVADRRYASFARVVVRMSRNSIYYVRWCQHDTPLKNLPAAPDNVRVWKFIKHGFEGISIECNGVEVADLKFSEARPECSSSQWTRTPVNFMKFNPDWDKTVGVGVPVN